MSRSDLPVVAIIIAVMCVVAGIVLIYKSDPLDPNEVCAQHHGTQRTYGANPTEPTAVICKDGYWEKER